MLTKERYVIILLYSLFLNFCTDTPATGDDWRTYQHDRYRSGVSTELLNFPLSQAWIHTEKLSPVPAWAGGPAKQDFWHNLTNLKLRTAYDRAFHVSVSQERIVFGSSASDKVVALDAVNGRIRWTYYTNGPVRFSPVIDREHVYFGGDDGYVYCVRLKDGSLRWRRQPADDDYLVLGHGRLISSHPIRTGLIVDNGIVYGTAGLFPRDTTYLFALKAEDGQTLWQQQTDDLSPQGYLLASAKRLYVPTGRTNPVIFAKEDGRRIASLEGSAGSYALLTPDDVLVHGPGDQGQLALSDQDASDVLASFRGLHMIVTPRFSFLQSSDRLTALDRMNYNDTLSQLKSLKSRQQALKKRVQDLGAQATQFEQQKLNQAIKQLDKDIAITNAALINHYEWQVPCPHSYSLILAGDTLIAGGDNEVGAYSMSNGLCIWTAPVNGKALGLAVADGRLYVSTHTGSIHCFSSGNKTYNQQNDQENPSLDSYSTNQQGSLSIASSSIVESTGFLKAGPYVHFTKSHEVSVIWETKEECLSKIEYGMVDGKRHAVTHDIKKKHHHVILNPIKGDMVYTYRIFFNNTISSPFHQFDSTFDDPIYYPQNDSYPYQPGKWDEVYEKAAEQIISQSDITRGYCVILDFNQGRLAYELAKRTELKFIGLEQDAEKIRQARERFDRLGLYGNRVVILSARSYLDSLPYRFANLVVRDGLIQNGTFNVDIDRAISWLRPNGGMLFLKQTRGFDLSHTTVQFKRKGQWYTYKAPALFRSGEWTHAYANPANTTNSNDQLIQSGLKLQWYGRPGPRLMVDRHHRPMPSLYRDGRLFIPADERIIGIDAYNGTRLWDLSISNSRRVGILKDCGHMAVAEKRLYAVAEDRCCGIDVETGVPVKHFYVPQRVENEIRHWGYIAVQENYLVGSGRKVGAVRNQLSKVEVSEQYGDYKPLMTSDYLFAYARDTGKLNWIYKKGVIINSTLAIDDSQVYFIESRHPEALNDSDGRLPLSMLTQDQMTYLVGLDLNTGDVIWEQPFDFTTCQHVLFLSCANGKILITGTMNRGKRLIYNLYAFDQKEGNLLWDQKFVYPANAGGDHGEQVRHPVIVGDVVYSEPFAFKMNSGERIRSFSLQRQGHGCGTLSGCQGYLFGRGGNPRVYALEHNGKINQPLTSSTRPGCWINILPVGGMVLMPESSSGCTCGYPIQSSMALISDTIH